MDEKDDILPMDETAEPALVDEPKIQHKPEPEAEAAPAAEVTADQPRGPDGKFASKDKGDKPAEEAASAPPAPEPENIPVKALQDERRKRQELEQQVAAMQQQLAQRPATQEPPPEFWENPEAFMAKAFEQHSEQLLQRFQQQQMTERLSASEAAAKMKHPDYDDAFVAFQQAASANPSLVRQMTMSADPGEFAYTTGRRAMDLERVGSFDELLKAERAKWEAEAKAAMPAPQPTFPTSTASDGSVAGRGGPVWSGPTPDKTLLNMG